MNPPESNHCPPSRRFKSRMLVVVLIMASLAICCALLYGFRDETHYTCPLTGRDRSVIVVCGVTISDRVTTNSVSDWAEAHGLPGIVAGQHGWELASTAKVRWFAETRSGSAIPLLIPQGLNNKSISIPDYDYKKALQAYQQSVIDAVAAGVPLRQAQQEWLNGVSVPDAASLTITCHCSNGQPESRLFTVANQKDRTRFVQSLRYPDWSQQGMPLNEIKIIRPDIDIILTDSFGNPHTYQMYWRGDGFIDQDSGRMLTDKVNVARIRANVTAVTGLQAAPPPKSEAKITIVVVDSSTVTERKRVDVEDPALRTQFVDAIDKLDLSGDSVPMSVAADMPALEINLTIVDEDAKVFHISLYWGDSDGGGVVYKGAYYQVKTGLSEIRELISESTGLTQFGIREPEDQKTK